MGSGIDIGKECGAKKKKKHDESSSAPTSVPLVGDIGRSIRDCPRACSEMHWVAHVLVLLGASSCALPMIVSW